MTSSLHLHIFVWPGIFPNDPIGNSSACSERSAFSIASGASNSSYGGNSSTATLSNNEPASLTISEDDFDAASAYGKLSGVYVVHIVEC